MTVRLLDETPAVLLLPILCSKHGYSFEWKSVKLHDCRKIGSQLLVQWTTSCFLSCLNCHLFQPQFVFNIEINSFFFLENWDHYQIQSRLEVTSMHAGNRCWQILTSRPRETVNQHAKHFSNEMYKEDPTQDIPDWLQPVAVNLEDMEKCARRFLWKSEHRFGRWRFKKWRDKKRKHSIHAYFRKYRERSIPRTEEIGDLTTVEHKILNEGCESRNNHQFADVVQGLTIQWILLVWKQNFTGDGEEFLWKFSAPWQKPKVIHMDDCEELSWKPYLID